MPTIPPEIIAALRRAHDTTPKKRSDYFAQAQEMLKTLPNDVQQSLGAGTLSLEAFPPTSITLLPQRADGIYTLDVLLAPTTPFVAVEIQRTPEQIQRDEQLENTAERATRLRDGIAADPSFTFMDVNLVDSLMQNCQGLGMFAARDEVITRDLLRGNMRDYSVEQKNAVYALLSHIATNAEQLQLTAPRYLLLQKETLAPFAAETKRLLAASGIPETVVAFGAKNIAPGQEYENATNRVFDNGAEATDKQYTGEFRRNPTNQKVEFSITENPTTTKGITFDDQLLMSNTPRQMLAWLCHESEHLRQNHALNELETKKTIFEPMPNTVKELVLKAIQNPTEELSTTPDIALKFKLGEYEISTKKRVYEYISDNYAVKMGYGKELVEALLKDAAKSPPASKELSIDNDHPSSLQRAAYLLETIERAREGKGPHPDPDGVLPNNYPPSLPSPNQRKANIQRTIKN